MSCLAATSRTNVDKQADSRTHEPSTVSFAAHARRGLIIPFFVQISVLQVTFSLRGNGSGHVFIIPMEILMYIDAFVCYSDGKVTTLGMQILVIGSYIHSAQQSTDEDHKLLIEENGVATDLAIHKVNNL